MQKHFVAPVGTEGVLRLQEENLAADLAAEADGEQDASAPTSPPRGYRYHFEYRDQAAPKIDPKNMDAKVLQRSQLPIALNDDTVGEFFEIVRSAGVPMVRQK